MRKRCQRTRRHVSPPMLINRGLLNTELETQERMFVEAFAGGWATEEHFDNLADMRDALLIAAAYKKDASTLGVCRLTGVALQNIRDRHRTTGRLGASGDELQALRLFATTYRDFWLRQPVGIYETACAALNVARKTDTRVLNVQEMGGRV